MFNLFKKKKVEETVKEESQIEYYRHKKNPWEAPEFNRDEVIKNIFQRDFSRLMPKKNGKAVAMDSAVCHCNFKGEDIPEDILKFYGSHFFIGWQACALLRQNPYIDKACTIPAQDAISPDYKISYVENTDAENQDNDDEKLAEMKQISDKDYNIKEVCYRANVDKKTFGISLVVPVIDGVNYQKPYNIEAVKKGSYKGMTVVEPYWAAPQLDGNAVSNPMNTGFQEPTWWKMPNGTLVHKSWCIKRCNSELPDILKPTYYYGGVPLTQKIYERVYAAEKVANEAPLLALTKRMLIVDANIENLVANECEAQEKIRMAQYYRDNFSMWFKNPDDDVKQIDTSLTDFDSLVMTQYQLVASIADMPATKLLKTQPKGFNATGEYEQKDYIQSLQAIQEQDYIPILKMHYELFTKSFYGKTVELAIVFNPVDMPSEKETAEVAKIWSDVDSNYISAGVMSAEEVRDVRRSQDDSPYSALADEMEGAPDEELNQAADEAINEEIQWITVNGNHVPLHKGKSKSESIKDFFDNKKKDEKQINTIKVTQYTEEQVKQASRKPYIDTEEGSKLFAEWSDEKDENKKRELEELLNRKNKEYNAESYNHLPNALKDDKYYMSESDYNDEKSTTSIYTSAGLNKERRSFDLQPINSRKYSDRMNTLDITRGNLVELNKEQAMTRWAKMPHSDGVFGGLSHSDEQIVKQYTYATPQNSELRKGNELKSAKQLSSIIDRSLIEAKEVYRGISGDYAKELLNKKVGETFTEKAFLSTSQNIDVAKSFAQENGAILHISIPRGYGKAIDVSEYTLHPEESEILLNKGQKFKISKKEGNDIFVEIISI